MDYKYIRAWEKLMGSLPYYKEMQLEKARKENAPETAIYRNHEGTWIKFESITAESTKTYVAQLVAAMED